MHAIENIDMVLRLRFNDALHELLNHKLDRVMIIIRHYDGLKILMIL